MHPKIIAFLLFNLIFLFSCKEREFKSELKGRTVEVVEKDGKFQLYRNGKPYFIKGASATVFLEEVKKAGGNSIRLYDSFNAQEVLDKAHELGLTVTLGLKMSKAITEMDYGDKKAVAAQKAKLKKEVLKYKDHPALLMWGIGNETTLYIHPRFSRPWSIITNIQTLLAINDLAKMVHELDPDHPTTTMLQGVPPKRTTKFLSVFCKEIDILSFNTFMTLNNEIPDLIKKKGWDGPYIMSEYGPLGYWITTIKDHTDWYAIYEKTSSEKARFIRHYYKQNIDAEKEKCLGSYVFFWGQKNEFTSTWFSFFLEDGRQTEIVDAMQYLWTNKWPEKRAPHIKPLLLNSNHPLKNIYIESGKKFTATFGSQVGEHEKLMVKWEILEDENNPIFNSEFYQEKPKVVKKGEFPLPKLKRSLSDKMASSDTATYHVNFTAPEAEGPYRLFLFVSNKNDKVATANAPFYVISMQ